MQRLLHRVCRLTLLLALLAPAAGADEATLNAANAHLQAGDPRAALELLIPLESELAGSPRYDLLLGIAAIDAGRPEIGIFALERVLAVEPENTLARAELARAYLRTRELDASRLEFERVRADTSVPADARLTINRYLDAFDTAIAAARTDWRGYLSFRLGYDSNVNAASDVSNLAIPVFGGAIFTLDGSGVEESSGFARVSGGIGVVHALTERLGVSGAINAYQQFHRQGQEFEPGDVFGHLGMIYRDGVNQVTLAYQGDHFTVEGNTNRNANGGIAQWQRALDDASQISVYGQFSRLTYRGQEIRNANRWVGGAAYSRAFRAPMSPVAFIGAYGGTEAQFADGRPDLGHDFLGVRAGAQLKVSPSTIVFASAVVETRDYGGVDPFFLVSRKDDRYSAQLGLTYTLGRAQIPFAAGWKVTPLIEYTRNDSNIVINDFERFVASLSLRRDFD